MLFREAEMVDATTLMDTLAYVFKVVIVYGLIATIIFLVLREILLDHWKRNQRRND